MAIPTIVARSNLNTTANGPHVLVADAMVSNILPPYAKTLPFNSLR